MAQSVMFRKKATDRLANPDDLDAYLKVTSPATWLALVGAFALLGGLLTWGLFGSVSSTISVNAAKVGGVTRCFLAPESVAGISVGDEVHVADRDAHVASVSTLPLSEGEVREVLGNDYLVDATLAGEWGYEVTFEGDLDKVAEGVPLAAVITTEEVAPASLLFGSKD